MKPMLACDADLTKVTWPMLGMPKIDGVRALNIDGKLVARSGKPFKNRENTYFFSTEVLEGFDGEMVAGGITDPNLCSYTTSAMNTIDGEVQCDWYLFDYFGPQVAPTAKYEERLNTLHSIVAKLRKDYPVQSTRISVVPVKILNNQEEAEQYFADNLAQGFEGTILRNPKGPYKLGRCTAREANYLRVKAFADAEIKVHFVQEGRTNLNELKRGNFGQAERSTNADNMVPNGMVGTITGELLQDIVVKDEVFLHKGTVIEIAPGRLTHDERVKYMQDPALMCGKIAKFQYFPIGMKDKLRFPTFQCFRDENDL
ncbi:DNA ligase [Alteromonas phage vB_AcoS-R7M]|uniref:DNA ligase n=1 Tax=Alteromonas phage vB_AcoS-R7M TaxID=2729541 RepID=A0A6M3YNI1_9CAUD|nr:DNA ligase [Alteromonas phage vB_AcoS-R7M]QJI53380.1 DNA ligase [Alteromonas phage vB_AcoS-R7M]